MSLPGSSPSKQATRKGLPHGTYSRFMGGCDCRACKRAFVRVGTDRLARQRVKLGAGRQDLPSDLIAEALVDAGLADY